MSKSDHSKENRAFTRRDFLKTGALSTLAIGSGFLGQRAVAAPKFKNEGDAKNVIFLVVDGMSSGTMALADLISKRQYGKTSHWVNLYETRKDYHRGLMDVASLDSVVTDSAASAAAWGSGKRQNNGAVNMGPDGEVYHTILEIFRDAGKSTGLVTSTRLTHATPAGFGANVPSRSLEDDIAKQYYEREYDVLMGGGDRHFRPDRRRDGTDLYDGFQKKGYTVVKTKSELARATRNSKMLGVFYDSHLPYMTDYNTLSEIQRDVPTLAEMSSAALERLSRNDKGFILQIEGGRVDHAAHGNDAASLIYDQIAFDDAIGVVLDFIENRDDTLVILTTDHGNANPGLNGMGSRYTDSPMTLDRIQDFRHSFEWMYGEIDFHWSDESVRENVTEKRVRDVVEYATKLQISDLESSMIYDAFRGRFPVAYRDRRSPGAVLSGVLANYTGIYFIGTVHTADYVELCALGPGSEQLSNFTRNTDLFDLMVDMAGVRAYAG